MIRLTDEEKEEIGKNWKYFESIHAELVKHEMHICKWIVIHDQKCVDIFQNYDDALEMGCYRYPERIICIIQVMESLEKCKMSEIHYVEKKMIDFGDPGEFKPISIGCGMGHWKVNEKKEKESYPVKEVMAANTFKPIIRTYREDVRWVSIRLVKDPKTYLGLYLGEVSNYKSLKYFPEHERLVIVDHGFTTNPVIYVPELNRCCFGYESWWGPIDDPEKIKEITDKNVKDWGDGMRYLLDMISKGGDELNAE